MGKFDTKHKVILILSLSHTASTGVTRLFIKLLARGTMSHPPFDVSWYSNISIYHQDVYTGLKKIKPYQNINWGGDITEDEFIEIINAPIETEYLLQGFHIDSLDDKQWVYDLLNNPPSNFIILVPVRHPYLTLLRKYNDGAPIWGKDLEKSVINMLNILYSSIDGDRIVPVPIDLLSTLPKDILKEELTFFFKKYLDIKFKWHRKCDKVFYINFHKQKNKKSELVMIEEVWDLSEPIIGILKRIGINYTDDLNNYNKFSFKNLLNGRKLRI